MEKHSRTDWPLLFTIAGSAIGIIAVCVGLWLHVDNKFESFQLATFVESKDFHGRLCAIQEKYCQIERR